MAKITKFAMFVRTFVAVLIAGSTATRPAGATEEADWLQAQSLGTAEAYFQYLRRNPAGPRIEDAVRALNDLGALGAVTSDRASGIKLY